MKRIKAYVNNHELLVDKHQTHVLVAGEWKEITEDQEGEKYFMDNGKAVYFDGFTPSPSTPVKDELFKIKRSVNPIPCIIDNRRQEGYFIGIFDVDSGRHIASINKLLSELPEGEEDADKICTAVNNTYGIGVNPEILPALITAVEDILYAHNCKMGNKAIQLRFDLLKIAFTNAKTIKP